MDGSGRGVDVVHEWVWSMGGCRHGCVMSTGKCGSWVGVVHGLDVVHRWKLSMGECGPWAGVVNGGCSPRMDVVHEWVWCMGRLAPWAGVGPWVDVVHGCVGSLVGCCP
jgi:hypothetical protein